MSRVTIKFILMIIALFATLIVCLPAGWMLDSDFPFTVAVAGTGFITFFGLYDISIDSRDGEKTNRESAMRHAIAGSIILSYLVLVSITAFFNEVKEELPLLTQLLLTNFTTVVGVVIAAYFGSAAYIEGKKQTQQDDT